jgi:hypothetical protein
VQLRVWGLYLAAGRLGMPTGFRPVGFGTMVNLGLDVFSWSRSWDAAWESVLSSGGRTRAKPADRESKEAQRD